MSQNTEELWQACTEAGEPITESGLPRSQAAAGALHMAAHVWIWDTSAGSLRILVQKRADDKPTWPGCYDISAAGHVDFTESPLQAAIRESQEELGLRINSKDLRLMFVHRTYMVAETSGIIENELQWVYGYKIDSTPEFVFDHEVASAKWLTMDEFTNLIAPGATTDKFVPHGNEYYAELLKEIRRLR
jgi:isopentenyldiphosphate isomerase